MFLSERFDVSPAKLEALLARIQKLKIDPQLIEESFTTGGGKGGQKINKTANAVRLYYPPLDISIRCQAHRRRTINRFLALRELVDQIEMKIAPETSQRLKEIGRLRKRKSQRRSRARTKYQSGGTHIGK